MDRRITTTATEITTAVQASSTLTQLRGIRNLFSGKILARVGNISRFRSAAAFVSYTATDRAHHGNVFGERRRGSAVV